ncbi:Uncharacterised protein [BD1-7 clade bacterium]|uniref:Uncharacterized protein n=1 Tax=BD1-7 clade bacterium TaxID=2029982 RepID=A0A5S9Q9H9_9GAMM|nr:Uncharacterised protein [BD1-7 clade bacterium]CAA0113777.1 Uncharacterised protein [BD1-7 clade bacterium]
MISHLKYSAIFLGILGVLFSLPLIALSLSVHGIGHALMTGFLGMVLVLSGPLSAVLAGSNTTDLELTFIIIFGAALLFSWLTLLMRRPSHWVKYLLLTGWALMGAYYGVLQVYVNAT